jgi:hypothetical protein
MTTEQKKYNPALDQSNEHLDEFPKEYKFWEGM